MQRRQNSEEKRSDFLLVTCRCPLILSLSSFHVFGIFLFSFIRFLGVCKSEESTSDAIA